MVRSFKRPARRSLSLKIQLELVLVVVVGAFVLAEQRGGDLTSWFLAIAMAAFAHETAQRGVLRAFAGARQQVPFTLGLRTAFGTSGLAPWLTILVALAGPLANGSIGLALERHADPALMPLRISNQLLAMIEILPLLPLDGGVVLRAILDDATRGRGAAPAAIITVGLGLVLLDVGIWMHETVPSWIGGAAALYAARSLSQRRLDARLDHWMEMAERATAAFDANEPSEDVRARIRVILQQAADDAPRARAAELGVWLELRDGKLAVESWLRAIRPWRPSVLLRALLAHLEAPTAATRAALDRAFAETPSVDRIVPVLAAFGRGDEAAEIVLAKKPIEPEWLRDGAAHLFRHGAFDASARVSAAAFERTQVPDHAYNAACALAQTTKLDDAIEWLSRAIAAGFTDAEQLRADEDLVPLRAHSGFGSAVMTLEKVHPYR